MTTSNEDILEAAERKLEQQDEALEEVLDSQKFLSKLDELSNLVSAIHDEFDIKGEYDFSEEINEKLLEVFE